MPDRVAISEVRRGWSKAWAALKLVWWVQLYFIKAIQVWQNILHTNELVSVQASSLQRELFRSHFTGLPQMYRQVPVQDNLRMPSYYTCRFDWNQDEACPVVPELVIEIISPEQTFGQLAAKARNYLDAQVLRVWVVDSKARSITVFYPDAAPQTYMGDTLLKDPLFEGLEFTASQLFQMAKIP